MRSLALLFGALVALAARPAAAQDIDALYRATAIVTGTGEENRQIGFRLTMEDVIVRVSGDYRLIVSGKAAPTIADAASFVTKIHYHDRYEGIPVHDEQGTHDRPHDLTVDFDQAKINTALFSMGSRPWLLPRPRLLVVLGVRNAKGTFVLSGDGDQGFYMRDSFIAVVRSHRHPDRPALARRDRARQAPSAKRSARPTRPRSTRSPGRTAPTRRWPARWNGATQRAAGSPSGGWPSPGKSYAWRVRGVSFDDAFRNALRGAAQVLSGNGQPDWRGDKRHRLR